MKPPERSRQTALALALALPFASSACGAGSFVTADGYASSIAQAGQGVWKVIAPGQRVVVTTTSCNAVIADTVAALEAGEGKPTSGEKGADEVYAARIEQALVHTGDGPGWLALELRDDAGARRWMRIPSEKPLGCVRPASDALVLAMKQKGRRVVFTPWKPTCTRIEATGTTPNSILLESESGNAMDVGGVVIGGASATSASDSGQPWLKLARGTIRVRFDSLIGCFTDADGVAKEDAVGRSAASLAHTDLGRCERSLDEGKEHVECRSSLGVWEGVANESAVSLRLVRRTLGPVHFLGGHPVAGQRYARALVSVTMGARTDDRVRALYDAMESSVAKAVAGDEGSMRVVPANDPNVGYRLLVDVANATIGDLQQNTSEGTSQYEDHKEERPNPAKEKARQDVANDEQREQEAEREYENDVRNAETARDACITACGSITDANQRSVCESGCKIGGAIIAPTRSKIEQAKSTLADARSAFASTPDTIMVPIMAAWTYKKKNYARAISATIRVAMEAKGSSASALTIPLSYAWSDYQQDADARHNVEGHAPDAGPIERADAVVPYIASRASEALAEKLRATISKATLGEAKRALERAGQPTKPGFEGVDAIAFEVAGSRLVKGEQRGTANVASGLAPFKLPSAVITLAKGECLLAVAVAEDDASGGTLTMLSDDKAFGDLRNRSYAAVEACADEIPNRDGSVDLALASPSGGAARWGLYRTNATTSAAKKSQGDRR